MATKGRTGRRRKRKKNGNYDNEYGRAIYEPEYIGLFKWAKENEISFGKLRPAFFSQTGRGLMTCKNLKGGDLVISVPSKMLITSKTAEQSDIGQKLVKLHLKPVLSAKNLLYVFILHEKFLGKRSFWYPYISTLPLYFNTPAYFNDDEICALPLTLQKDYMRQILTVQESYEELKEFLARHISALDKTFVEFFTFEEFRWVWYVVNTRSVYKPVLVDTDPTHGVTALQTDEAYALAPVLDLLNHTDTAEVKAGFNQGSDCYEIRTLTECSKGTQVFINYGPHDNRKLLMEYGFILPKNMHNSVPFSMELVYSVVLPELPGISQRKREIILFNQLDKDLCCSEENGLSWSALVLLRILAMDEESFKRDWQRVLTGEGLGKVAELRVSHWIQCLVERALQSYEEADKGIATHLLNHNHMSVNMQLALQLQNQEKQILESALQMVKFP